MVTITGGGEARVLHTQITHPTVTQYKQDGSSTSLPDMNNARFRHACGHFTNSANSIVWSWVLRTDVDIYTRSAGVYSNRGPGSRIQLGIYRDPGEGWRERLAAGGQHAHNITRNQRPGTGPWTVHSNWWALDIGQSCTILILTLDALQVAGITHPVAKLVTWYNSTTLKRMSGPQWVIFLQPAMIMLWVWCPGTRWTFVSDNFAIWWLDCVWSLFIYYFYYYFIYNTLIFGC